MTILSGELRQLLLRHLIVNTSAHTFLYYNIYTHTSLHMFGFNPIVNEIQVFNQKSAFVDTLDTYMVQISITFF